MRDQRSALVELKGPLDLPATLEPLRQPGDDLLDRWDGVELRRTVPSPGGPVAYVARLVGDVERPGLQVEVAGADQLPVAVAAVREIAIGAPAAVRAALHRADPLIARLEARHRGVRLLRYPDLFEALVRAISAQQVNLRWAATTRRRLAELAGTRHSVGGGEVWSLDPARVAGCTVAQLRTLQFTTRKAEYLISTAEAVAAGGLDTATLARLEAEEVVSRLCALRGIGRWTAEWVLARTLGRPVVVAGDLAVRKVVGMAYAGLPTVDEAEVRRLTAHWGEGATMAGWLLIHAWSRGDDLVALGRESRAASARQP